MDAFAAAGGEPQGHSEEHFPGDEQPSLDSGLPLHAVHDSPHDAHSLRVEIELQNDEEEDEHVDDKDLDDDDGDDDDGQDDDDDDIDYDDDDDADDDDEDDDDEQFKT
eukprot:7387811-Prymnesium_polylepis.1